MRRGDEQRKWSYFWMREYAGIANAPLEQKWALSAGGGRFEDSDGYGQIYARASYMGKGARITRFSDVDILCLKVEISKKSVYGSLWAGSCVADPGPSYLLGEVL